MNRAAIFWFAYLALILLFVASVSGCSTYVQRINSDCRLLRDFTVVDTDACVVCSKKNRAVIACSVSGDDEG